MALTLFAIKGSVPIVAYWRSLEPFDGYFHLGEDLEVVAAAGLGAGAGHVIASEGLNAYQGTCDFTVQV